MIERSGLPNEDAEALHVAPVGADGVAGALVEPQSDELLVRRVGVGRRDWGRGREGGEGLAHGLAFV